MKKYAHIILFLTILVSYKEVKAQNYKDIEKLLIKNTADFDSIIMTGETISRHNAFMDVAGFGIKKDSCFYIEIDHDVKGRRRTKIRSIQIQAENAPQKIDSIKALNFSAVCRFNSDSLNYIKKTANGYTGSTCILLFLKNGKLCYKGSDEAFLNQEDSPTKDRNEFLAIIRYLREILSNHKHLWV